jgi:hypothetical protein
MMTSHLDVNAPEVAMLADLFSPTLRKNMGYPAAGQHSSTGILPFTPTTPATAGFNLFSPHFSPQLNFLLNTPAVKESLQFAFPVPSNTTKPTTTTTTHPKTTTTTTTTTSAAPTISSPPLTVPQVTSPASEMHHTGYGSESEYLDDDDSMMGDDASSITSACQFSRTGSDSSTTSNMSITSCFSKHSINSSNTYVPLTNAADEAERVRLRKKMEREHKPARGRQRKSQLEQMTPEERELEREILMEKSRQSARDCRKRKKCSIEKLRETVQEHAVQHAHDTEIIAQLRQDNAAIRHELESLKKKIRDA